MLCRRLCARRNAPPPPPPAAPSLYACDAHLLSRDELFSRFTVSPAAGLTSAEARARLARHGANTLPQPPRASECTKWARCLREPLLLLLLLAAALAFLSFGLDAAVNDAILAGVLVFIVLLGATMSYSAQAAAASVVDSIKNLLPRECRALRDGVEQVVPLESLVPGDCVHLTPGNKVPADLVLYACTGLHCDVSCVTGESEPVECCVARRSDAPTEAHNLVFTSSLVCGGEGWGVVAKTGAGTLIGCIAEGAHAAAPGRSLMDVEVGRVIRFVVLLSLSTACVFLAIGLGRGLGVSFAITQAFILTLIANVPEGLPATITLILALCAKRCATEYGVVVKDISVFLTLGGVSVLCTDKTGTLTAGHMTVSQLWAGGAFVAADCVRVGGRGGGGSSSSGGSQAAPSAEPAAAAAAASAAAAAAAEQEHAHRLRMRIGRQLSILPGGSGSAPSSGAPSARSPLAILHSTSLHSLPPAALAGSALTAAFTGRVVGPGAGLAGLHTALRAAAGGERERERSRLALARSHSMQLSRHVALGAQGAVLQGLGGGSGGGGDGSGGGGSGSGGGADAGADVSADAAPQPQPQPQRVATDLSHISIRPPSQSEQSEEQGWEEGGRSPSDAGSGPAPAPAPSPHRHHRPSAASSWAASNAFTRLATIAVACNKAVFSDPAAAAAAAAAASAASAASAAGAPQPPPPPGPRPPPPAPTRTILGDSSDAALLAFADSLFPAPAWRAAYALQHSTPFSSLSKLMTAVVAPPEGGGQHLFFLKGAPERVLQACSHRLAEGEGPTGTPASTSTPASTATTEVAIDAQWRAEWHAAYERFACAGERVLGFAYAAFAAPTGAALGAHGSAAAAYAAEAAAAAAAACSGSAGGGGAAGGDAAGGSAAPLFPTTGLVFAGLISLADPPKPGARAAVAACRAAGIRVTMITGDHPLTAEAIARRLGMLTGATAREVAAAEGVGEESIHLFRHPSVRAAVVSGYDLAQLSAQDVDALLLLPEVVFARTSPDQKAAIVEGYQRAGAVCAMTGDGTNDAVALRKADVGIAMGSAAASDVAREVGDLLILNDDIGAIVGVLAVGRGAFYTIRKTIAYTVAHAVPELVPSFCFILFDLPIMLPSLLILVVDLLTEQMPAVSFVYDAQERTIMQEPPRNLRTERLIDANLILYSYGLVALLESLACVGAFFLYMAAKGYPASALLYQRAFWAAPPAAAAAALAGGVASYFFTLVLCQAAVHAFSAKTLRASLGEYPWWRNRLTNAGVLFALGVALLAIFPLQGSTFGTGGEMSYWVSWVLWVAFAALFLPLMEAVKYCARRGWTRGFP